MKKILLLLLLFSFCNKIIAQKSVGNLAYDTTKVGGVKSGGDRDGVFLINGKLRIGNTGSSFLAPNSSSILDVTSTTKGILIPRLTTAQMNAIVSPLSGLLIWNTDSLMICSYNGTAWRKVFTGTNFWYNTGNTGTNNTNFIGTVDSVHALQGRIWDNSAWYIGQPHSWLTQAPLAPTEFGFPGQSLVTIGYKAGQAMVKKDLDNPTLSASGYSLTAIGGYAGTNIGNKLDPDSAWLTPGQTTVIGNLAAINLQYGSASDYGRVTTVGSLANFMTVAGQGVTSVGAGAMERGIKVTNNTAIGKDAMRTIGNGSYNTALGTSAGGFAAGIIDTIIITNGGSGYTTATITVDPPKTYGQPNMPALYEAVATATPIISLGVITGATITFPGIGYVDRAATNYTHGSWTVPTVTITGDGVGATATAVVANSNHNTWIGQAAGWRDRASFGSNFIGSWSGANNTRYKDSLMNFLGYYTGVLATVPTTTNLKNATAIGALTKVAQSNTVILGDSSQNTNVGIGTSIPNSSALLEMKTTSRGLLIPRLTTPERDAIVSPAIGLMVYNTTDSTFNFYRSSGWGAISSSSGWSTLGNVSTDSSINFIGTTDNRAFVFRVNNEKSGTINSNNRITSLGYRAADVATGVWNTALGADALGSTTTGTGNTAIGDSALASNVIHSGNVAIGGYANGRNANSDNTIVGFVAFRKATSSGGNTVMGKEAMYEHLTGNYNVAVGTFAKTKSLYGAYNIAMGRNAQYWDTIGNYNVMIGTSTGNIHRAAHKNIIIGNFVDGQTANDSALLNIGNLIYGTNIYGGQTASSGAPTAAGRVSIGVATANASAILDLTSTDKGVLMPRQTTAQRDAIVTPATGLQVYDSTIKAPVFYNGYSWGTSGLQTQSSRVTSQFDKTSNTTLDDITGLTATLVAGKTYRFEAILYTTSNVAGGVQFAIAGTATATNIIYESFPAYPSLGIGGRGTALGTAVSAVTAVTAASLTIKGTITVNAAGTLTVQFAQNASFGTASSVLVGSTFVVTEII